MTDAEADKVAITLDCAMCGAAAGHPCTNLFDSNRIRKYPHARRLLAVDALVLDGAL